MKFVVMNLIQEAVKGLQKLGHRRQLIVITLDVVVPDAISTKFIF